MTYAIVLILLERKTSFLQNKLIFGAPLSSDTTAEGFAL